MTSDIKNTYEGFGEMCEYDFTDIYRIWWKLYRRRLALKEQRKITHSFSHSILIEKPFQQIFLIFFLLFIHQLIPLFLCIRSLYDELSEMRMLHMIPSSYDCQNMVNIIFFTLYTVCK